MQGGDGDATPASCRARSQKPFAVRHCRELVSFSCREATQAGPWEAPKELEGQRVELNFEVEFIMALVASGQQGICHQNRAAKFISGTVQCTSYLIFISHLWLS